MERGSRRLGPGTRSLHCFFRGLVTASVLHTQVDLQGWDPIVRAFLSHLGLRRDLGETLPTQGKTRLQ